MSGRTQALMRTRCPGCGTVFRVTSEQLRLKAGKVRCGHCQGVFNAFDQLLVDAPPVETSPLPSLLGDEPAPPVADITAGVAATGEVAATVPADQPPAAAADTADMTVDKPAADDVSVSQLPSFSTAETLPPPEILDPRPLLPPIDDTPGGDTTVAAADEPETEMLLESLEQPAQAARAAGLMAAREWSEAPAYNRWAADALAGEAPGFAPEAERRVLWPFVVATLLLLLILAAQLLNHFRTEVVRWLPATAAHYELLGIAVPLPRQTDLVAIESSDLQFDNPRGLFVLQATLRNRAPYAQEWPALELTLTDAGDAVVARRVMTAAEYLPPAISPERFPANGEVAVRLWIEARDLGAAGYRLYVFYP